MGRFSLFGSRFSKKKIYVIVVELRTKRNQESRTIKNRTNNQERIRERNINYPSNTMLRRKRRRRKNYICIRLIIY